MMALLQLLVALAATTAMGNTAHWLNTTRAVAACTPSTIFVPVTVTVTSTATASSCSSPAYSSSDPIGFTTVFTSMVPITTTVTIFASNPAITVQSISSMPTYYFYVTSGSTVWQDGISPASGQLLTYATTSYTVVPVVAITSTVTSLSTELETFTPPAYTSTFYSLETPDATTTLTSTHYVTVSLSEVVQPTRSLFTGIGSDGWNASTESPASTSSFDPAVSTSIQTYFTPLESSSVDSTTTIHLTSTMETTVYSTIMPPTSPIEPLTVVDLTSVAHSTRHTTTALLSTVTGNFSVSGTNITSVSQQNSTQPITTVHETSTILTTLFTTITASSSASSRNSSTNSNATASGSFSSLRVNATQSSKMSAVSVNATQSSTPSVTGTNKTSSSRWSAIKPTIQLTSTNGTMLYSTKALSSVSSNSFMASINATTSRNISATHITVVTSSSIFTTQDSATVSSNVPTIHVNATISRNVSTMHTSVTMSSSIATTHINATISRKGSMKGIHVSM